MNKTITSVVNFTVFGWILLISCAALFVTAFLSYRYWQLDSALEAAFSLAGLGAAAASVASFLIGARAAHRNVEQLAQRSR